MKRIILSAIMLIAIAASAFASFEDGISRQVRASFSKSFNNAKEVKMESQGHSGLVKVTFVVDGQKMFAYYQSDGEQVAISRNLQVNQLPIGLFISLKKKLEDKWLTNVFEVSINGETAYYATLIDADHITIIKAPPSGFWNILRKTKR